MALGYTTSVQIGAFIWLDGLKWVKMGSKWAQFTCLSTSNGLGSFSEKLIFDPFMTHFRSPSGPISRLFRTLEGPKWLQ